MKWQYTILPEPLHEIANLAIHYFINKRGVRASTIRIEEPIALDVPYRATITAKTSDHYTLCVDVAESAWTNSLDDFVLTCRDRGIPVKLFIAMPKNTKDPDFSHKLKTAKSRGVGLIEIDVHSAEVLHEALPLSLGGVRPIDVEKFPASFRQELTRAESLFRNGSPDKGCSVVFDEMESICRLVGKKTHDAGHWIKPGASGVAPLTPVKFNFEKGPWGALMPLISERLDVKSAKCPGLSPALISRVHGVTPHRNETGHKPKDAKALMKRDRELRTRFEGSVDLLQELIVAVKPLHVF